MLMLYRVYNCLIFTIEGMIWLGTYYTLYNISFSNIAISGEEMLGVNTYHPLYYSGGIKWNQRIHPMFADCTCLTIALYVDILILLWNCCFILRILNYRILLFAWLCKKDTSYDGILNYNSKEYLIKF